MISSNRQQFDLDSREFATLVVQYTKALRSIELKISLKVRSILQGHFHAVNRRLSVLEMGQIAEYKGPRAASLPYGLFGARLSKALGQEPPTPDNISVFAEWDSTKDKRGHGGWVMYEEMAAALEDIGWATSETDETSQYAAANLRATTRSAETTVRVGQELFRAALLNYWKRCAVTSCCVEEVLVASHIVPWSQASDHERMDVFNGLLLTPNLDRLFDQYLISFDDFGAIQIAPMLSAESLVILGIHSAMKLYKFSPEHRPYLARHFTHFKALNNC